MSDDRRIGPERGYDGYNAWHEKDSSEFGRCEGSNKCEHGYSSLRPTMRSSRTVNAPTSDSWSAPEVESRAAHDHVEAERQLALVDRIIGLEAELAELAIASSLTPSEQLGAERQLIRLRATTAWRIGRLATAPVRIAKRVVRRGLHR